MATCRALEATTQDFLREPRTRRANTGRSGP